MLVALAVLATAGYLAFVLLGFRALVITSGSMTPTLQVGDLVVSRPVPPDQLHPGDLVTFRSALFHGDLVTHRVMRATVRGPVATVETRGDANSGSETWSVPATSRVGLGVFHVRYAGWWFAAVNTRPGHVAVFLLAFAGLVVTAAAQWRGRR